MRRLWIIIVRARIVACHDCRFADDLVDHGFDSLPRLGLVGFFEQTGELEGAEGALSVWGIEERVAKFREDVHYGLEGRMRAYVPSEAGCFDIDRGTV